jgi:hypothetical protein
MRRLAIDDRRVAETQTTLHNQLLEGAGEAG